MSGMRGGSFRVAERLDCFWIPDFSIDGARDWMVCCAATRAWEQRLLLFLFVVFL